MRVPVLPSPALQWTASASLSFSAISMNYNIISYDGTVPSTKNSSCTWIPFRMNREASYVLLLRRTTAATPIILNTGIWSSGVYTRSPYQSVVVGLGELIAINFPGIIQFQSPFSSFSRNSYSYKLNDLKSNQLSAIARRSALNQSSIVQSWRHCI